MATGGDGAPTTPGGDPPPALPDDDELAAYEHVVGTTAWSRDTLAAALGCGLDDADRLVERLVNRQLLRVSQQDDSRLVPVPPVVGLGRVAGRAEDDLLERTRYVGRLRALTASLTESFERQRAQGGASDYELLRGRDAALARVSELLGDVREEVCTVMTSPPTDRALQQARSGDLTLLERGVAVRGLYLESHRRQSPALREHLSWLTGLGAEVRVAGMLPSRFMLFDRSVAAVSIQSDDAAPGAVIVRTDGVVTLLTSLFDLVWQGAVPAVGSGTGRRQATDDLELDELEQTVIRLMATGAKDLSVSRATGLSVRSVRRVIASLSERLGAESRFELGVRCRDLDLC